ncbi:glycosyltransferase family 4 protein [Serratia fonticola]|uniref:glycosyltransferase family 4 protein n=1 Tax=Serratia fonticola TaxID=47917 RepID=UPI003AAB6817
MMSDEKKLKKSIIILHDVDGRIYFQGIEALKNAGEVTEIVYRETSVFRRLVSAIVKRTINRETIIRALNNLWFRVKLPFIKDKIIILGIAPYNFRFLIYSILAINNKVIYHTSWPYWWTENVPSKYGPLTVYFIKAFRFILNKFEFSFVCVTHPVAQSLASNLKNNNVISVIPHAVDLSVFNNCYNEDENFAKKDIVKVLYVGRMVKEKGVYEIADLVKKLKKSHHFSFVGSGSELQLLMKFLQGQDNVSFYGQVNDKTSLANIFKEHDVLLLPSKRIDGWEELFGLVLIEAMACGLIVIATDHIGPRGIIKNGEDGIIIPEHGMVKEIENILLDFAENKENWSAISERAKCSVKKYSLQSVSRQWQKVIYNDKDSV